MRILAIRGRNLASLEAGFDVDFRREPLASAGLFAICGPTGAGKSTLLDALCLALYGRTPRLSDAFARGVEVPDVGDGSVSPQDPRTLLRRGAAEGCAEVDFVGNDGEVYRATWSVRRARGKVDGRLQPSEVSLVRLRDATTISAKKTEALAEAKARLGLEFPQFTRAVLLAQNEFGAFLKADDNERAALLERLTGTDVYGELSKSAHQRASKEQGELEGLRREYDDQAPLAEEERRSLEEAAASAEAAAAALDGQCRELDAHLRWHRDVKEALAAEAEARAAWVIASQAHEQAAGRRGHLALVESVTPAATGVAQLDRAAADVKQSREEAVPGARLVLEDAAARLHECEAVRAEAVALLAAQEDNVRRTTPQIERARALDAEASALEAQRRDAASETDRLAGEHARARERLEQRCEERRQCLDRRDAAGSWLDEHVALRPLVDGWPRWETLLSQALEREGAISDARREVSDLEQRLAGMAADAAAAEARRLDAALAAARATEAWKDTRRAGVFDTAADLHARRDAERRRDVLAEGERLRLQRARGVARRAELEQSAQAERARAEKGERRMPALIAALVEAEAVREDVERGLATARLARSESVETLRRSLDAGQPCPVCGSVDHPYRVAHPDLDGALAALESLVAARRERVDALKGERAGLLAAMEQARERGKQIEDSLETTRCELAAAEAAWLAHPVAGELADVAEGERSGWFASQLAVSREEIQILEARQQAAAAAAAAEERAREALDEATAAERDAERLAVDAASRRDLVAQDLDAHRGRLVGLESEIELALEQLDPVFAPAWRTNWTEGPTAFVETQRQCVEAYQEWKGIHETSAATLLALDVEIQGLSDAALGAVSSLRRAHERADRLDGLLSETRAARARVLDGRSVAEAEAALHHALSGARADLDARNDAVSAQRAAEAAAGAALAAAESLLAQRTAALATAQAALDRWITDHHQVSSSEAPLDEPGLRALLRHDQTWVRTERSALQGLDERLRETAAILGERRQRREAIQAEREAGEDADAALVRRQAAGQQLEEAKAVLLDCRTRLRRDDERGARRQALRAGIERQERLCRLWSQVDDLIGSASGAKFRNYAQQLTLDVLLGFANRHLTDLSRRYRLERLENRLALIVVDHDMGDEIRSVHSLSGGESFLVSLALALGLASLSANRIRVESLFIDEGFGHLDAETLSVAMDALDRLQTQGRKVGVISHVREMAERIGVQVRVDRQAGGRSIVSVRG